MNTIGRKENPVRNLIDRAMEKIPIPTVGLPMVVDSDERLRGFFAGPLKETWSKAVDLSAKFHIIYKPKQFHTVLGRSPEMYDELWTAGKVMYKLEEMVADHGRLIIYGPHIKEVSRTWGKHIKEIGYHVRDYFLLRMEQFDHIPKGVLAHSTHVRGIGEFIDGREKPRIEVVLATSIPDEICGRINLGYMRPDQIVMENYMDREDEGILYVDHAGEILYKLQS